jgi:hypothetical protein
MSNFESVFNYDADAASQEAFVAHIPSGLRNRNALFKALSEELGFPDYFGNNWDALSECLRDLSWIHSHRVAIIHATLPALNKPDLLTYLKVLADCVQDWKPGEEHQLVVVFPQHCRDAIHDLESTF